MPAPYGILISKETYIVLKWFSEGGGAWFLCNKHQSMTSVDTMLSILEWRTVENKLSNDIVAINKTDRLVPPKRKLGMHIVDPIRLYLHHRITVKDLFPAYHPRMECPTTGHCRSQNTWGLLKVRCPRLNINRLERKVLNCMQHNLIAHTNSFFLDRKIFSAYLKVPGIILVINSLMVVSIRQKQKRGSSIHRKSNVNIT